MDYTKVCEYIYDNMIPYSLCYIDSILDKFYIYDQLVYGCIKINNTWNIINKNNLLTPLILNYDIYVKHEEKMIIARRKHCMVSSHVPRTSL